MKKIYYFFLFAFAITACNDAQTTDATDQKAEINPLAVEELRQIDRKIIREYVNLQQGMNFDSTESGIFYHIEEPGIGEPPTDSSMVTVHYTLYLVDNSKVESSYDKNEPSTFKVSKVIKGWNESLKLLGVMGKGTFVIPSYLGYGPQSVNGMPRNAILVFDIEVLKIEG